VKELVEYIARKLVEHPDDVSVTAIEGEESQDYELRVNPEDMGRIIGKNGRTAKGIRTLVGSAGTKSNVFANLEIVE